MASVALILASRFVAPLRTTAESLRKDLMQMQTILELWVQCQKMWLYLSNIFSGSEIRRQLPQESFKFDQVDKFYRSNQMRTSGSPNVMRYIRKYGSQIS